MSVMTIHYETICDHPAQLKTLTTLTREEFEHLLPFFGEAYAAKYPATHTQAGSVRQRAVGGGRVSPMPTLADKLLFILRYAKTYPLQAVLGIEYGLSQGQISTWVQVLTPLLQAALRRAAYAPAREAAQLTAQSLTPPVLRLHADGTERRRRRPRKATVRTAHYSGKKKPAWIKTSS